MPGFPIDGHICNVQVDESQFMEFSGVILSDFGHAEDTMLHDSVGFSDD